MSTKINLETDTDYTLDRTSDPPITTVEFRGIYLETSHPASWVGVEPVTDAETLVEWSDARAAVLRGVQS